MKKQFITLLCLGLCHLGLFAQNEVYNDGSLIHVQQGAQVYVQGEVNNASGNLENEGKIELQGNWSNTGNYLSDSLGLVIFSGTGAATISGNMTGVNDFFILEINKTSASTNDSRVSLNTDIEVASLLRFTGGRIVTGIQEVYVTAPMSTAITGHTQAGSAIDDRYVEGYLKRNITASGANYDFPVGASPTSLGYQLMNITFSNLSTTQSLTAFFQSAAPTPPNVAECGPTYACVLGTHGQWLLTPDQGSPIYDLQAVPRNFGTDCGAGTYTLMTGSQLLGDPCVVYTGLLNPTNGTIVPRTGLSTFAPIAITGSGGLLPVELLTFEGYADGQTSVLNWVTDHEVNNDYFEVQRSEDGDQFYPIGQRKGQGSTEELTPYTFIDDNPLAITEYYRLKQVDFDGTFSFTNVVEIHFDALQQEATVFPNPFHDYVEVFWPASSEGAGDFELFNLHGQLIWTARLHQAKSTLSTGALAEGLYYYRIIQQGEKVAQGKMMRK